MKFIKSALIVTIGLALFLAGAIFFFNRLQPSEIEIAEAQTLTKSVMHVISNENQNIFYEASRNTITINVYGVVEISEQNAVLDQLNTTLSAHPFDGKVDVNFYSARVYLTEQASNGNTVSTLKQSKHLRTASLKN